MVLDFTFCVGEYCPLKEKCDRYVSGLESEEWFSSWMAPKFEDEDCEYFIDIENENTRF